MTDSVQFEVFRQSASFLPELGEAQCEVGPPRIEGTVTFREVRGAKNADAYRFRLVQGAVEAWKKRVRALVPLSNPRIISVYAAGVLNREPVVLEDAPEGEPLSDWARRERIEHGAVRLKSVRKIALQVADALRIAHSGPEPVVHGALEAAHVYVKRNDGEELDVRVAGFGLWLPGRVSASLPSREAMYACAPEVLELPGRLEPQTDLFAFAVLLLDVLVGSGHPKGLQTPWRDVAQRGPEELLRVLREQREDMPDALCKMLVGLLAAQPQNRKPNSAKELHSAMRALSWTPKERVVVDTSRLKPARPEVSEPAAGPQPRIRVDHAWSTKVAPESRAAGPGAVPNDPTAPASQGDARVSSVTDLGATTGDDPGVGEDAQTMTDEEVVGGDDTLFEPSERDWTDEDGSSPGDTFQEQAGDDETIIDGATDTSTDPEEDDSDRYDDIDGPLGGEDDPHHTLKVTPGNTLIPSGKSVSFDETVTPPPVPIPPRRPPPAPPPVPHEKTPVTGVNLQELSALPPPAPPPAPPPHEQSLAKRRSRALTQFLSTRHGAGVAVAMGVFLVAICWFVRGFLGS